MPGAVEKWMTCPKKNSSNFHPIQPHGPVNRLGDGQFRWMSVAALRRVRGSQPKNVAVVLNAASEDENLKDRIEDMEKDHGNSSSQKM